ncbi:MAG: MATE family efflux transporter [Gammaproteobacteria bacterium]|nr:MATE family efflux transporter [Gammaproteobacteria bacterium]
MRLSGYMIMGFLAMTMAQLVEAVYLGFVGKNELAAIAFSFPVVMALNAATRGLGIGAGAVLARAIGAGDRERAALLATHCLILVVLFTFACVVVGRSFAQPLFSLIGATGHVHALAVSYFSIWLIGFPAFGLAMVGSGLMRAMGDAAYPGYVMTVGSVIQVVIGPFLIFGWLGIPELGISGAAWAFVIARTCSFAMTAHWFFLRERIVRRQITGFVENTRSILHVGLPAGATNLIQPLSYAVITWILAGFGTSVVAGFGVASRIDSVVTMVVIGISASAAPLVGQNWGARLFDRVRLALKLCYRYCLVWGVGAALIMWVGAEFFVRLINEDPEVVDTATSYLYIVPISIGFLGMMNVANASFNALSKPMPPLILSLLRMLVIYIPLAIFAGRFYGYVGVFVVTAFTNVLIGLAAWRWNQVMITSEQARLT